MTARLQTIAAGLGAIAIAVLGAADTFAQDGNMAHAHMGHVMESWKDTPDKAGLLPTAEAEAEIAAQHAGLAAQKPDDLGWMQTHTAHVLHAVDPEAVAGGPGKGYGLIKALGGAAQHTALAAKADGASDAVKAHSEHVRTSLKNAEDWAERIEKLAGKVADAKTADAAAEHVSKIETRTGWILEGRDKDGDGAITWQTGEGGLAQARQHMGFMYEAEGLSMK